MWAPTPRGLFRLQESKAGPLIQPVGLLIRLSNLIQTVILRPARPSISDGMKEFSVRRCSLSQPRFGGAFFERHPI